MPGVNAYKDGVVNRLFKGLTGLIKGRGITVIEGAGRRDRSARGHRRRRRPTPGRHLVLASGSYSAHPARPRGRRHDVLTSEQALRLDRVPASVVVLGGGVIGCEFASVWRSFGAEVTIVEALPRLVAAEDEASSKVLERTFRKRKIAFRTGTRSRVSRPPTTASPSRRGADGEPSVIEAELLLVAVGRGPSTSEPRLRGARRHHGSRLRARPTSAAAPTSRRVAVGDIVPGPAARPPRLPAGHLRRRGHRRPRPAPIDEAGIPRVTYSQPELASVGLTEAAAIEAYGADGVESLTYDLGGNGKSQILKTQGFVKLVRAPTARRRHPPRR